MSIFDWEIAGSGGEPIVGTTHRPAGQPRGVVVLAHGFKGYKDYGLFPWLAAGAAETGFIAHRFNFSHSGMTRSTERFERPNLFEADTWNRQVVDCRAVLWAIDDERIEGGGLPTILFGHSRGGVAILLCAGRHAGEAEMRNVVGLCTAAAPSTTNALSEADAEQLLREGHLLSPSSRTAQNLRIGAGWLREQLDEPEAHDLLPMVARISQPILIIHGDSDPTVPLVCSEHLANAARNARRVIIAGGDHVFNTPNPFPVDGKPSSALAQLGEAFIAFANECCTRR